MCRLVSPHGGTTMPRITPTASHLVLMNFSDIPDADCQILRELRATPELFAELAGQTGNELQMQQRLRTRFSPELVRAALTLADLRLKARTKFALADSMWFDPKGLEQATSELVARHKAQRFTGHVWDFCCGIGADAIGLAASGCHVRGVELLPANCLRATWNAEVHGVANHTEMIAADLAAITDRSGLLHIDPDRRPSAGKRVVRLEDCLPNLSVMQQLATEFRGGAIKLSPASNFGGKFDGAEIELISLNGECKEATIWFGELAQSEPFRATVLPAGETLAANPLSAWTNVGELGSYVFDPDPAVVRSGLVDVLAERLNLRRLDDAEEYLTGNEPLVSPFVQTFEVLDNLPNNDRDIRAAVRQHEFGQIEIKCRHIPVQVETVRRKLTLEGSTAGVLIFTRQAGRSRAVICKRMTGRTGTAMD